MIAGIVAAGRPIITSVVPPAIGAYWAGEGGHYAGQITYSDSRVFHLVLAASATGDVANRNFGYYGVATGATSLDDGYANEGVIEILGLTGGGAYPPTAFQFASGYSADGKADFYIPAENELQIVYNNLNPGKVGQVALFATGGAQALVSTYYWSSTEASANGGRTQKMDTGAKLTQDKYNNVRVRPVRRIAA